jgi:lipopolysaccharide/colanic/teichoic acid biosynthesis glycosyltransferase
LRVRVFRKQIALIGEDTHSLIGCVGTIDWHVLTVPVLTEPVSAIVVGNTQDLGPEWEAFIGEAVLQGIPVHDVRHMKEILTGRVELRHLMENSFGSLIPSLYYVRLKRPVDFVAACAALILVLPVMLFFALLIRLESPGPAIFRQQRRGFRGRPFTCYKLRSMRIDRDGPKFTAENDQRITRVGRFIRKWRIDELPQIINILKGDMSWIGPRPEAIELAERYESAISFFVYRHAVRPGISGWAAVHQGNVNDIDAATIKLQHDFFYIKYCSLWLDALITLKTLRTIVTGFGSR